MRAITYTEYGSPDVLQFSEAATPAPKDDEVLIRIRAASLNPLDWHFLRGIPYFFRLMTGLKRPNFSRLGVDAAGRIEAVGRNVTQFKPGDDVFGSCRGAFAEYACGSESGLALKPGSVTFEQAASVPVAGVTALQALRDHGKLQPGQKVLINGAAGGVGTFAVQIAKFMGAAVTGVCSTRNVELVRSLGADQVIDYTQDDFTKSGKHFDVILDNVGNHPLSTCLRVLNRKGVYLAIGGGGPNDGRWLAPLAGLVEILLRAPFVSQKLVIFLAKINRNDLTKLGELIQSGKVTPFIDRSYPLSDVAEAIRYLEEGHARGKVVITMEPRSET